MTDHLSQSVASPTVYEIEVCKVCGGQLSHRYNRPGRGGSADTGRCGNDPSHGSVGGVLLLVTPLPLSEQVDQYNKANLVAAGVVPNA